MNLESRGGINNIIESSMHGQVHWKKGGGSEGRLESRVEIGIKLWFGFLYLNIS